MAAGSETELDRLVAGVGRGEPAAVRAFTDRQLPRVWSLAHRLLRDAGEAEDVAQEAMLRAWRQAPRWRPGAARFDTWLHQVTLNLCRDRLRRRREVTNAEPPDRADPSPDAERNLLEAERGRRVAAAIAELPERQRDAIVLCHQQGLGNIEAAAALEVSVEALESLLARGRRTLKRTLTGGEHDA